MFGYARNSRRLGDGARRCFQQRSSNRGFVGNATEALEYVERARGHLYAFHQLIGRADFLFEESARRLEQLGHHDQATSLWRNLVGRDVLENRWTFEIVERFDDDYYDTVRSEVRRL